ncbi:MAG: DUF4923 family protein [Bacteroidales bacterium]|nr:DUF4923 family protein [Bacteroidales bacterium]
MKIKSCLILILAAVMLSSCGSYKSSSSSSDSSGSQSLVSSLLSSLVGNSTTVTPKRLSGTWKYSSPECRFTSENALTQAGGAVAANTIEGKLTDVYSKIGISASSCSFTFDEDGNCSMTLGGRTIKGTYTLDSDARELKIRSTTGLISFTAQVYYSYSTLTLLFDWERMLSLVKMVTAFTGQGSSTISALSSLLNQYDGMMVGMNLKK